MDESGRVSRRALLIGGGATGALLAAGGIGAALEWNNPAFVRLRGGCGRTPDVPASHYAVTSGTFNSTAMGGAMPWVVALPPDHQPGNGTAVVLVLHGANANADMMSVQVGLPGFATAVGARLAFAAPGGGAGYYWHPRADGHDPLAWAVEEFLPMVERRFGVGGTAERRATFGWSMGGFGALLVAQQHPGLVTATVAASPAVFPSYDAARSGHPDTFDSAADWSRYGLWDHLAALSGVAARIDCGSADPFAPTAQMLLRRVPGATGSITDGCHDVAFWRRVAPAEVRWLAGRLAG